MTDRTLSSDEAAKIKQWSDEGIAIMAEAGATEEAMRAPRLVSDLAASVVALHTEIESYQQTSADLCGECGWRFFLPGEGCLNCNRGKVP